MTYYAVIDTNVIVSFVLKPSSIPGLVVELVNKKTIMPLINKEILDEYEEVLFRNKFGIDPALIQSLLKDIKEKGIYLEREQSLEDFIDKDDVVFLKSL